MINKFLQYLQYEKNYSTHTICSYENDLKQFVEFVGKDFQSFNPEIIQTEQIQQWILAGMNAGVNARTISRRISTLRAFWRFMTISGFVSKNPTQKIILPKTNKPLPVFFKQTEVDMAIDDTFLPDNFEAIQNNLILRLLYLTGVRVSELVNLDTSDFDYANNSIKVTGKRNKQRIIPVSDDFKATLRRFEAYRDNTISREGAHFFSLLSGKKLYVKYVYNLVHKTMSDISSLHKNSPHVFRHTFATTLINEGADINAVKELLGHSSLAATQVYTHTGFSELYNIYKRAHPRAN